MQGGDHVGRRGKAPLAGFGHVAVLVEQVHRQGMAVALGGRQRGFFGKDKAHARHAFQAFAGGGDQRRKRYFAGIDWQCTEGAHGVDDQAPAVVFDDLGNLRQWVENAGAGFTMDQRNVGDGAIGVQQAVHIGGGGGLVFSGFEGAEWAAKHFANLRQTLAIGAVDQHQHLAIARNQGAEGGFDGEGATALQRHAMVAVGAVEDRQQLCAYAGGELVEAVIP